MRLLIVAFFLCSAALAADPVRSYPESRVDGTVDVIHGTRVPDPYRWLEDQDSPATRAWIEAQVAHTRAFLDARPGRAAIASRLAELNRVDTAEHPKVRAGIYFYRNKRAHQNQYDIFIRRGPAGPDELLVDVNGMSADGSTSAAILDVSSDAKLLAYGVRRGGRDEMVLRIMNARTRRMLPDEFPEARYFGVVFDTTRNGLYYSIFTPAGPRVRYHQFGAPVSEDKEIFGKGLGPQLILAIYSTPGAGHALLTVFHGSAPKSDLYLKEIATDSPAVPVVTGIDAMFFGSISGRRLYISTTWNAPNGRVMVTAIDRPERSHWREFIPESESVLQRFVPAGQHFVRLSSQAAVSRMDVLDATGQTIRAVPMPALGTVSLIEASGGDSRVWFDFNSINYPHRIYEYETRSGKLTPWRLSEAPVRSEDFEVKQAWYESRDKTRVPVFLAHRKGIRLDGRNPVLVNGYGGFSLSRRPTFTTERIVWMEAGGVIALPGLRGGGEFGEKWHQAGMLDRKQNVFDDFIAAIEWLIDNRYTSPPKIAISGGSNGGLLVGAVATQRPDLFQAAICGAPLLDMIRYHKFLVARWWIPEYGSSDDPKQFQYLLRYSPYHNVKNGVDYPAMLFVTGDSDTRVHPLHARKMTALMQASTGSERPILLHYDTSTGHSGGKPVDALIADRADELTFLFSQLKVRYKPD